MDYARIYSEFIADRRFKGPPQSGERHHIVPRCVQHNERKENIIYLTFGDHLFAHLLLAKFYGGKCVQAARLMLNRIGDVRGRAARSKYEWVRKEHIRVMSEAQTIRMQNPALRRRTSEAMTGRPKSAEALAKRTATRKIKPPFVSAETRETMAARLARQRQQVSFESGRLAALRATNTGREKPQTEITKISDGMKLVWQKRKAGLLPMPKVA